MTKKVGEIQFKERTVRPRIVMLYSCQFLGYQVDMKCGPDCHLNLTGTWLIHSLKIIHQNPFRTHWNTMQTSYNKKL